MSCIFYHSIIDLKGVTLPELCMPWGGGALDYWVSLTLVQDSHRSFCHRGCPQLDRTPRFWENIPPGPQSGGHLLLAAVNPSDNRVTDFGLSASRTALNARRRGRHTSSAPTATAGCAAPAQRNTGMSQPQGAHSLHGHKRGPQVQSPVFLLC